MTPADLFLFHMVPLINDVRDNMGLEVLLWDDAVRDWGTLRFSIA